MIGVRKEDLSGDGIFVGGIRSIGESDARAGSDATARASMPMGNSKVLQALRALSAVCVVLFHVNHSFFANPRYWIDQPFGRVMEAGHAGVEFFFVLSGFIIYAAHRKDIGNPARLGQFLWKRFRRVYPVYWVVLAMVVPVYLVVPSFGGGQPLAAGQIVAAILLVNVADAGQILTVSWTLFHEVAFYAIFSMMILDRRLGVWAIGVWCAASTVSLVDPGAVPAALRFLLSPLHTLFAMGMIAAWLIGRQRVALPGLLLAGGGAVFLATAFDDDYAHYLATDMQSVFYGLASTLVLLGAVELERCGRLRVPRVLTFLGDASYSVYLVHMVAMSVLAKVALAVMQHVALPHAVTYVALAGASIAFGLAFHLVVERPLISLLGQVPFGAKSGRQVLGRRTTGFREAGVSYDRA